MMASVIRLVLLAGLLAVPAAHGIGLLLGMPGSAVVYSAPPPDTTPDSFSFTDQTNVALSSTITSAAVTITGIDTDITCTASGGTIDLEGDNDFQTSHTDVSNNEDIRARHTSSGSNSTATNTAVTCGGVSDTFTSTTLAEAGDLTHGESYIISGSGFGSKSSNTLVWDNASHGDALSARWSGWWPTDSGSSYNLAYRTPAALGRGVALPHNNITSYISGAHTGPGGPFGSYNVGFWRTFTRPSFPYYSYWHWYERVDPNWTYDTGSDNNFKYYGIGNGSDYYSNSPNNWYIAANACSPGCGDMANSGQTTMSAITNDDASGGGTSYIGFATGVLGYGFASPQAGWVRREVLIRWDNASGGTGDIRFWTNNTSGTLDSAGGYTDDYSGTTRSEGPGGYARDYPDTDNWRYWADVMYDRGTNPGRFYLTNNATYSSATIREPQPWTSWSDTSVTITVNKGTLSSGTVHLHYRNEAGTPQYVGAVTID